MKIVFIFIIPYFFTVQSKILLFLHHTSAILILKTNMLPVGDITIYESLRF